MTEFIAILASTPVEYIAAGSALQAAAGQAEAVAAGFAEATSQLSASWSGRASEAQQRRAQRSAETLREVAQVLANAGRVCQAGGAQLAAAAAAVRAIVESAYQTGFVVFPTAVVLPGPAHYAQAAAAGPGGPAILAGYQEAAQGLTSMIEAAVGEASALDDQTAAQLRAVLGRLADLVPGVVVPSGGPAGLTHEQIEREYGILVRNQKLFQQVADDLGLVIDVRPTNTSSVPWLHLGGLPKPQAIKAKTINDLDVLLGADERFRGAVGFFQPRLPPQGSMSDEEYAPLVARYRQRTEEQLELGAKMRDLATHAIDEGRFEVHGGVVYGYDSRGIMRPVTGDHDMFDIRRPDGTRLPRIEYTGLIDDLTDMDMGVQHGAHMYWQPETEWERVNVYEPIVRSHKPGGEPLVRFWPGRPPTLSDSNTPV
jgi:uncharacterized protein YukE